MEVPSWIGWFQKRTPLVKKYLLNNPPWFTGAVAALISVSLFQLGAWKPLEYWGSRTLFQIREAGLLPNPEWDSRIAVIAIEKHSLQKYGKFPWSRNRYIDLLESLKPVEPIAIGFDILFLDPSPEDEAFAASIKASNRVVLATLGDEPLTSALAGAAKFEGIILHEPDGDGISRQSNLWFGNQPSFATALVQAYNLRYPGQAIPIPPATPPGSQSPVWINWPGKTEQAETYAFSDVVEGVVDRNALANKLLLIGFATDGLDTVRTPLDRTTGGVYVHAALIDNLLNNRLLKRLSNDVEIILLLLLGPTIGWLLFNKDVKGRIILSLGIPVAWFTLAALLFGFYHWLIPLASPIGTAILAGIVVQVREQYEKQQLMKLFEKHVAPETAQLIWKRKAEIFEHGELEPQELTATVLFMDIRSFTSISEKMQPRELLTWLNNYLEAMTECIMDRGGVVDKYIGDAIMAVFGVPFVQNEQQDIQRDAVNAIAACIAMHDRLDKLNQQLQAEGKPAIKFGIGLHTGQLVAGSVGGSRRLNYSVIGDAVNVAARLEAMNKEVKSDSPYNLLVTDKTFEYVCDRYEGQKVNEIQLRGKKEATVVYAILRERRDSESDGDPGEPQSK